MRPVDEIKRDLDSASREAEAASRRVGLLKAELEAAMVAGADHPWLGKLVQRRVTRGWKDQTVLIKGKLLVYGAPSANRRFRGLYPRPMKGEMIVVASNGEGSLAYNFYEPVPTKREGETDWELVP